MTMGMLLLLSLLGISQSASATVVLPFVYSSGTTIKASEVNANEGALASEINSHEAAANPHQTGLSDILSVNNSVGSNVINFALSQGQSFRVENLSADPTCNSGSKGRLIWNTVDALYKVCNGTSFVSIAGSGVNTLASVLNAGNSTGGTLNLDMAHTQLLSARLENANPDPSPGHIGRIFYSMGSSTVKIDNGVSIGALGGAQSLASVLSLGNQANTSIDFNANQAVNMRLENLSSDPGTTAEGRIYENTTTHKPKYYNGSAWTNVGDSATLATVLTNGNTAGSSSLNMNSNQVTNLRLENSAGSKGTGPAGLFWFDTSVGALGYATGSATKLACSLDDIQTLTNKSINGLTNTITNIQDSSLSSNVLLKTGSQTITGTKTFSPAGFPITSYIGTPSGAQHQLTDGLSNDTFTLNGAVQTLAGKTLQSPTLSGNLDFAEYQGVHMRLENLSSQPAAGNAGRIYYNSSTGEVRFDNGTQWAVLTASANLANNLTGLTGDVTATGPGTVNATVNSVGGQTAANIATATLAVNTAQSGNVVFASPAGGGSGTPAFRLLIGADLPNPTGSQKGGVLSIGQSTSKWINSISTSGVPSSSQPAFTDISGSAITNQLPIIPNSLGGLSVSTVGSTGIGHWANGSFSTVAVSLANQADTTGLLPAAQGGLSVSMAGSTGVLREINGTAQADTLVDADIKASASIAQSKIGSGTATGVWTNAASGAISYILPGTANNVLVSSGGLWTSGAVPSAALSILNIAANYSVGATSDLILIAGNSINASLPTAVGNSGHVFQLKKTDNTFIAKTIYPSTGSGQTIDGATSYSLNSQYDQVGLVSDGSNWQVLSHSSNAAWTAYTPIFSVGWGAVTGISFFYRRVGANLYIKGTFTAGVAGASSGTISLPSIGAPLSADSTVYPAASFTMIGSYARNASGNAMGTITINTSTNYTTMNFARQSSTEAGLNSENVSGQIGNTETVSFTAGPIAIQGWSP